MVFPSKKNLEAMGLQQETKMAPDEEENAVKQLCDLIGAERVAEIAARLCGREDEAKRLHSAPRT